MADVPMNVHQKLAKARLYFLNKKLEKSGKNMQLEFKYFELDDIVPTAIRIFDRVGLVHKLEFSGNTARMTIINTDDSQDTIEFVVPFVQIQPIVSNAGKMVTNPLQALGSSITYLRRYLWMIALDITEPDSIDATLGAEDKPTPEIANPKEEKKPEPVKAKTKPKTANKPKLKMTESERKEAKIALTKTADKADDIQIQGLKKACKALLAKDAKQEEFINKIALKTKGFTEITREQCEQLVLKLGEMIKEYGEDAND